MRDNQIRDDKDYTVDDHMRCKNTQNDNFSNTPPSKPGAVCFNADKQVFSPKPCKKFWRRSVLSFSRKTQKRTL